MQTKFLNTIETLIPELAAKKCYVAVSGGIDSMVLLWLCKNKGLNPVALHCNFKLRDNAADQDEEFLKKYCHSNQINFISTSFNTVEYAKKSKETIQVAARNLRYQWFDTFIRTEPNAFVLTAHHQNDSVETFFINLLRGTGLYGLQGIPEKRNQFYRPLLYFTKKQIIDFANDNTIPYVDDESNSSRKYLRNKLRLDILPELHKLSDNFNVKLSALISEIKQTNTYLTAETDFFIKQNISNKNGIYTIKINTIETLPDVILMRVLATFNIQRNQINEIKKLLNSVTGSTFSNNYFTLLKDRENIIIKSKSEIEIEIVNEIIPTVPYSVRQNQITINFSKQFILPSAYKSSIAYLDLDKINFPLFVSNQYKGSKIQPLGMKGNKLVSDILIDAKLNKFAKEDQLIISSGEDVICVVAHTINHKYRLTDTTKNVLKIELSE